MSSICQNLSFNLQSIHSAYAFKQNHFYLLNFCQVLPQAKSPILYGGIVQMLPFLSLHSLFAKSFGLNTVPWSFSSSCLLPLNYCSGEDKTFNSPLSFPSQSSWKIMQTGWGFAWQFTIGIIKVGDFFCSKITSWN